MLRCLSLLPFMLATAAQAETFVVTRFDDPLPDTCLPGDCSLREAAMAATANDPFAGLDRIQLAAGSYTLIRGELPLGAINHALELVGAGSAQTHVSSDAALFDSPNNRTLSIRGLSFEGGGISMSASAFGAAPARLVLDDVTIPSVSGGGNQGIEINLEIRNSSVANGVDCNMDVGQCTIVNSRLSSLYMNSGNDPGAALVMSGSILDGALDPADTLSGLVIHRSPSIEISGSTITRTEVGMRAAGTPPLTLRLHRLNYSENSLPLRFSSNADVEILDSVFRDNPTRAIYAEGDSTWSIGGTSFVNNTVDGNAGGAIVVEDDAQMHIENSTFSGNRFDAAAAAAGARGAAIGWRNGTGARVDLRQVTIVRPAIMSVGVQGTGIGGYGGTGEVAVNVYNSILAGSCRLDAGTLHQNTGNIESPADTCGLDADNQVGVDADDLALGTLGDHGGPTPTYLPEASSVAINAADANACTDVDQRGYARPSGGACDVGAIEVGADDVLFADGFD